MSAVWGDLGPGPASGSAEGVGDLAARTRAHLAAQPALLRPAVQALVATLPGVLGLDDAAATLACERVIRDYDPCISCATHFLRLTLDR